MLATGNPGNKPHIRSVEARSRSADTSMVEAGDRRGKRRVSEARYTARSNGGAVFIWAAVVSSSARETALS